MDFFLSSYTIKMGTLSSVENSETIKLEIFEKPWYMFRVVCAPVAQLDRVSDYESESREFESLQAYH